MTIAVDSWEQNSTVIAMHDEKKLGPRKRLGYDGPAGEKFAYDLVITSKAEQAIRCEAKWSADDAYATWRDRQDDGHSRLSRQAGAVDLVIVVWDDFKVEMQSDKGRASGMKGLKNRLARMNVEGPSVCVFGSLDDAISFIRYLEGRKEPLRLRPAAMPDDVAQTPN